MKYLAGLAILLVAGAHFGFLVLEMFYWDHPIGREAFSMSAEQSAQTAVLAGNQGLYNGFLGAGLVWSLVAGKRDVSVFFLMCAIIAGVYGAMTAKLSIIFIQALPAFVALALLTLSKSR